MATSQRPSSISENRQRTIVLFVRVLHIGIAATFRFQILFRFSTPCPPSPLTPPSLHPRPAMGCVSSAPTDTDNPSPVHLKAFVVRTGSGGGGSSGRIVPHPEVNPGSPVMKHPASVLQQAPTAPAPVTKPSVPPPSARGRSESVASSVTNASPPVEEPPRERQGNASPPSLPEVAKHAFVSNLQLDTLGTWGGEGPHPHTLHPAPHTPHYITRFSHE